jgi:hypothetical protein
MFGSFVRQPVLYRVPNASLHPPSCFRQIIRRDRRPFIAYEPMKRIAAACIRVLAGAFAGFVVTSLIVMFAGQDRFGTLEEARVLHRFLTRIIVAGTALGAVLGGLYGSVEIRGRVGAVIKTMALGGLAGVPSGAALAKIVASIADVHAKSLVFLGVFAGLVLGVAVGGIVGATVPLKPLKTPRANKTDGVGDRMLDG